MQTKRGSTILVVALIVLAVVLAGTVAYKLGGTNYKMAGSNVQKVSASDTELTQGDEISDIEKDLNLTQIENLDSNVVGVSSEVN